MTRNLAAFAKVAAVVAALFTGAQVIGAMPENHAPSSPESVARNTCMAQAAVAGMSATNAFGMAEGLRTQRDREARCPPAPRDTWDQALLSRAWIGGGVTLALLLAAALLTSMARREDLAEEALRELRRERGHR